MNKSNAFAKLLEAVEKTQKSSSAKDDNDGYWFPQRDKAGNGFAVIRFLSPKNDGTPFIKLHNHGFQGPGGKWYIESCPTTIGSPCPACEANGELWNSGNEKDKDVARKRKRRTTYIANILVVQDQKNPENEGKVFLFKFGQKIFDKIIDKIKPQFEDEQPMNPFDLEEGANFKLKIRQVEGFANYDKSEFDSASPVPNADAVVAQTTDLDQFLAPEKFKKYEDLKKRLDGVLGTAGPRPAVKEPEADSDEDFIAEQVAKRKSKPAPKKVESSDDDDEDLAFFKSLSDD